MHGGARRGRDSKSGTSAQRSPPEADARRAVLEFEGLSRTMVAMQSMARLVLKAYDPWIASLVPHKFGRPTELLFPATNWLAAARRTLARDVWRLIKE